MLEGGYRHWAVSIETDDEDGSEPENLLIQASGSQGRYYLDMIERAPESDSQFINKVEVFALPDELKDRIVEIAGKVKIRNYQDTYNCQDFALDLLAGIADELYDDKDKNDEEALQFYAETREELLRAMDGIV